ncbi:hypothetical protein GQ457_15G011660 [Hibiscus cannabinus]
MKEEWGDGKCKLWDMLPISERREGEETPGTDTLREVSIPSLLFFKLQIPVSNLGTDTQREYRYPRAGTGTLRLVFQKGYRYPKPWYRYPLSRMAELAGKTPPTAPNKVQRSPTARITFGTIKQASKHQGKTNASLYNIIMIKNCLSD